LVGTRRVSGTAEDTPHGHAELRSDGVRAAPDTHCTCLDDPARVRISNVT
jgi:hypothetical protein